MARNRWTLAIILICLPILATVITAFRIRDLPKPHESSKLDTKSTQPCENCDVKVGQKVHSVKIESDKHKYEDVKKAVREKQQLINEKVSESKFIYTYDFRSDEDDDDDDNMKFPKIQTGFKQEYPKDSKLSKSGLDVKTKINSAKISFSVLKQDNDDKDDDNKEKNNNHKNTVKVPLKPKISEVKKVTLEKTKVDNKSLKIKMAAKKHNLDGHEDSDDDENDDDDDDDYGNEDKSKVTVKTKLSEIKNTQHVAQKNEVKSAQTKMIEVKKQKADSHEEDDDDDDDEDDDYEGLDNIEELFKILDMKPKPKLKSTADEEKVNLHNEIKSQTHKQSEKKDFHESSDSDNDDNDEDNHISKISKIKLKTETSTTLQSTSKGTYNKNKLNVEKSKSPPKIENTQSEKKLESEVVFKDTKEKSSQVSIKPIAKDDKKDVKKNKDDANVHVFDSKKAELVKKEEKPIGKLKGNEGSAQKSDKDTVSGKNKSQAVTIKEDKKETKNTKAVNDKPKTDSAKKTKEIEKEAVKTKKDQEKDDISSSLRDNKIDKSSLHDLKKGQTDHKDIFRVPERKKDIKYDFEKPNAYKSSQKTFDYSEFEKMQVTKQHPKENKKKEKALDEKLADSREERYLKHVTEALNRRNLLKSEFEDFYAFFPTFAPNFSRIHNPECRRHGQILLRQLRGMKLWALNMLDATAKIPSGVLQGNGIQLGDFDQCLGSRARVQLDTGSVVKVQGKYCLARIDVKAEHTELEAPVYLAQAKNLIRSRIDDPGHFVPRFSTLSWGVCVPSACNHEDVEVIIKDAFKHYQHKSGIVIKVKVDEDDCHMDEGYNWEEWLELPTVLTLSFYGVVILLVLVATVQDFVARRQPEEGEERSYEETERVQKEDEENKEESKKSSDSFLSPFSLYRTFSKLTAPGTSDEISCIHGIRGLATVALLVAHKFMPVAVMPYTNRLKIAEVASSPLLSWCRAGWIFTDCFLLLSGALTSHRIASDSDTSAVRRLFSRYFRLTPALLAVVLFYAFIWDKLSTGPMWGTFVTKNAEICEQGWWWNILYVQNYFGMEDMCAPQTHQLALDMQLTILGGVVIWAIQSSLGFARLLLPGLHLLAAYFRYTTVRDHRLTLLAYHGVSVSQLYRTARLSYVSTLHRCSPYLIGLSLGLALKKPSKHGKFLLTLGWMTSTALWALVVWSGIDSGSTQYRYNAIFAAQYATIAPVASAMAIAWVIYAVHSGTCGFLSRVLCWRPLVFISRLSYALYLCQFIIFITNISTVRTAREFTLISLIDVQEISAILLSSIVLTVTFVTPMQSLHKVFSYEWKSKPTEASKQDKETNEIKYKNENESKTYDKKEATTLMRSRHNLIAHREVLEEIPEVEVEYETQRENTEGLDEIVEEEEGTIGDEDDQIDDLEIIEEEEAGEEEAWQEREEDRSHSRGDDQDLDEWEWTSNGRSGAQYYRYAR